MMVKSKLVKATAIGMCCTMISTGAAIAMTGDITFDRIDMNMETKIEYGLSEKHREINEYIFETHREEITKAGFTVTHTGSVGDYIEIGITPYTENNANYLYKIFGREEIKVVEGVQAVTLPLRPNDELNEPSTTDEKKISNESSDIGILINDEWLEVDVPPFIENSRALMPLRAVAEKLDALVKWYQERKAVVVYTDDIIIELVIGQDTARVIRYADDTLEEETIELEVKPRIVENRTFVPGRFVVETLGAKVDWDNSIRAVIIETNNKNDVIQSENEIDFEEVEYTVINENEELLKWYRKNFKEEGIYSLNHGEWIYVLVAAGEKSTGGYSLQVNSINEMTPQAAYIYATLESPGPDADVTQALTYPNTVVRFLKGEIEEIKGEIKDINQDKNNQIKGEIGDSLEKMGKAIPVDSIKEMKLYSLMQEEIKSFTSEEIKEIITQLNTSPTYNGPILEMLTGNSITIILDDGGKVQLTSYGNKDHVVVSGKVNEEYISYCVVNTEIGSLLLK